MTDGAVRSVITETNASSVQRACMLRLLGAAVFHRRARKRFSVSWCSIKQGPPLEEQETLKRKCQIVKTSGCFPSFPASVKCSRPLKATNKVCVSRRSSAQSLRTRPGAQTRCSAQTPG